MGFFINTLQVPNKVFSVPKKFCVIFFYTLSFFVQFAEMLVSAVNLANCQRQIWCQQIVSWQIALRQIATHPWPIDKYFGLLFELKCGGYFKHKRGYFIK